MTITDFKQMVLDYVNRDSSAFAGGGSIDHVLQATNNARRVAQRSYAFEMLRKDVFLTTSQAGASWQTGCKTTPGGATQVLMRRIDSVWNYSTNGSINYRTSKIDLGNINDYKRELPTFSGSLDVSQARLTSNSRPFAFLVGGDLMVNTAGSSTTYLLNGISWLDDLTLASSSDIFLTYFTDWLLWATIQQLNQYLKDGDRVNIDTAFMQNLWMSVKEMDGQNANTGDNATLD